MKWIGTQTIYDNVRFKGDVDITSTINFTGDTVTFSSANPDDPAVIIKNSSNDANDMARLQFWKDRGADGQDGDNCGEIEFWSYDDGTPSEQLYAKIHVEIEDATAGQESGFLGLQVANHDGGLDSGSYGLKIQGGSVNNEVDVTIGSGAASVTDVQGTLSMGGTNTINNSGVVQVAAQNVIDHDQLANFAANEHFIQANITAVGTIGTGVWQSETVIASAYLDADTAHLSGAQRFTGAKTFDEISSAIFDGDKDVTPGDGAMIHVNTSNITDSDTSASGTAAKYTHVSIEHPRLLATEELVTTTDAATLYISGAPSADTNQTLTNAYALWVDAGTVQFDADLKVGGTITGNVTGDVTGTADIATIADTVTITDKSDDEDYDVVFGNSTSALYDDTGTLTYNPSDAALSSTNFVGALTGQADTVATIAGLAPNTATTQAIQPNIESIGTDGDTLNILSDTLSMTNTTSGYPTFYLTNQTDDTSSARFTFIKQRVDSSTQAGEDSDVLGKIQFYGYNDGTPAIKNYSNIYADIHDATTGEESGRLTFQVANHDGGLGTGLKLTGGSANNEIDVTLGLGAEATIHVTGNIDMGGSCNINASHNYTIDDTVIIGDSSGTATLYNIDALDATTEATIESAIDTLGNLTSASSLVTVGTIGTGVWEGTAVATAYIADDAVTFAKAVGVSPNVFGSTIKLLPSDFAANIDGGNTKFGVGYTDSAGAAYGMKVANAAAELYAFVSIPEGMTATHVDIYDKDDLGVVVYEVEIDDTTMTSKGTGNCNTTIDITDVDATATNFLAIQVTTTATTNKIFGGKVTIAAQ